MSAELPVLMAAQFLEKLVRMTRIRIGLGPFGKIDVKLTTPLTRESIDARLEKIEAARQNLSEALVAMDELKETAESNKRDLEALTGAIARAENDKVDLNLQLEALKKLADIDTDAVREALRIPTEVDKWKERIWGFLVGGILAGVISAALWEFEVRPRIEAPQTTNHVPAIPPK